MSYRVIFQPRAERDLRDAALWIRGRSKSSAVASRWVRSIRAKVATLKDSPERCPVDEDSEAFGVEVRVLMYGRQSRYRVLFRIQGDAVHVLAIRHSARRSFTEELADDETDGGQPGDLD